MKNFVLSGVEDARYMTLEYAEALRESGCYLEKDSWPAIIAMIQAAREAARRKTVRKKF